MAIDYLTVNHISIKRVQSIFSKITIDPTVEWNGTPCWQWTGYLMKGGYGAVEWKGASTGLHRVMYAWAVEPIPKGALIGNGKRPELDHLCRRRHCCNPVHLELVARRTNILRGDGLCSKNAQKTHCIYGHELTEENIYRNPNATQQRNCLTCKQIQRKKRYDRDVTAVPFFWRCR